MPNQQSKQGNNQGNPVLQSQQSIIDTFEDIVRQAQVDLTQAQAGGNEDSIKRREKHFQQALTQLTQARTAYNHTAEQIQE